MTSACRSPLRTRAAGPKGPISDTIVAVSTPPGRAPRGLVRLSGQTAPQILRRLVALDPPAAIRPRQLIVGRLRHPPLPALVTFFAGPHSYTGQHVAELQLPGNAALLDRVIHQALRAGARLAEPGEFTFRAFTSGKIDLIQAEGVAATIAATSDSQLRAATMLRDGKLGRLAAELVDLLANQLALVEAGIDFVDQEDVVPIPPGELDRNLADVAVRLAALLGRSRSWGGLEALPRVVLVGPPSVGKSTLFNALLGRRRAVISAMPGTTRDVLCEPLSLALPRSPHIEVMLVDIAGLNQPVAALDKQVQAAARRAIEQADLILRLENRAQPEPPYRHLAVPPGAKVLTVHTKSDLPLLPDSPPDKRRDRSRAGPAAALSVSALTGENLHALRRAIGQCIGDRGVSVSGQLLALTPRHESSLRGALDHVDAARKLLAPQRHATSIEHLELIAGRLRCGLDDLAGLGGQLTPDDVIGRVFATFCVGK